MSKGSKVLLVLLAIAAALVLLLALGVGWAAWHGSVPQHTLLELDFERPFVEQLPDNPIASIVMEKRMRLRDLVEALHAAARDPHVSGLLAHVDPGTMGVAQVEEVRDAVLAFRAAGKPAIAWSDTFGEATPANGAYYLATAFDQVFIQPSGDVGLTGLDLTTTFLRGTLDKLGVEPEFAQRYQYKNAVNTYTEKSFTPPHREAMDELAGSIYDHMVAEIARARKRSVAQVQAAIDAGPLMGDEAVRAGLVDGVLYRDQVYARAKKLAAKGGSEPQLLWLRRYWQRADKPWAGGGATIAVVYGVGEVRRGRSDYDPLGGAAMGGDTVAGAIRAAADDRDVKAILLRVDSPGGSYVASDTVWREVVRAREKGKPVVASMGDVAASGGYFIAMAADKIVAQPSTLTGSIGVFGGKMVTKGLFDKVGISFDSVQRGAHADMWSAVKPFDPDEWTHFNGWLDRVYLDFTTKAAQGRHLPLARLQEIARGHVWSGVDAQRLGLVDALGGYEEALRLCRQAAHLRPDAPIALREYPRARSPWQSLFADDGENSNDENSRAARAAVAALQSLQPALRVLRAAGLLGEQRTEVLRAPDISVR